MPPQRVTIEPPSPKECGPLQYASRAQSEASVMSKVARLMGFKRKNPPNFPPQKPIFIFNVSDQELVWREPGFSRFVVPACKAGARYSEPIYSIGKGGVSEAGIPGIVSEEYLDDSSTEWNHYNAIEIAFAILKTGPGMKGGLDERNKGFFLSETNPPKPEEVEEAHRRYAVFCDKLIEEGDRIATEGESKGINGQQWNESHKRALVYRRQTRQWGRAITEMTDCPLCLAPMPKGAAIHMGNNGCGGVIDWDKAVTFGLRTPEQRDVALGAQQTKTESKKGAKGPEGF